MKIFFVMGITNSGKTHFIDRCLELDGVEACQVGKEFRRRYPPDHFKGQGAPSHTEKEALEILDGQLKEAIFKEPKVILIDGQPRTASQVNEVVLRVQKLETFEPAEVLLFHADEETITDRATSRATDAENLRLSLERTKNDRIQLYDVLIALVLNNITLSVWQPEGVNTIFEIVEEYVNG